MQRDTHRSYMISFFLTCSNECRHMSVWLWWVSLSFWRALQVVEVCALCWMSFKVNVIHSATSKRDVTQLLYTKLNAVTAKEIQHSANRCSKRDSITQYNKWGNLYTVCRGMLQWYVAPSRISCTSLLALCETSFTPLVAPCSWISFT